MEPRWATNFDEYVGWMAMNSPHVAEMRSLRNRVAHGSVYASPEQAACYARQSLNFIGGLGARYAPSQRPSGQ